METDGLYPATSFNAATSARLQTIRSTLHKTISSSASEDITVAKMLPQHSSDVFDMQR